MGGGVVRTGTDAVAAVRAVIGGIGVGSIAGAGIEGRDGKSADRRPLGCWSSGSGARRRPLRGRSSAYG
jgi:hypothetical protein